MGLFGSLFTGVSALFAQSQNTAIISNNIANISTTGFKRSEAAFESLVTSQSRLSTYSPGTVTVNRIQRVDQQGSLQQTSSGTDAAVSGNGFFPVKRDASDQQEFLYTRAGQFSEDAQGLLRNAAGFALYAWPIDAEGNLPANQGDLTSLVPADVAFLGGLTRPTSQVELAINLDADQEGYNLNVLGGTLPLDDTQAAHFSRGVTVFDQLGSAQPITFEYRKTVGPMANSTSGVTGMELTSSLTDVAVFPGNSPGDQFSITVGGTTRTYDIETAAGGDAVISTVGDFIQDINSNFTAIPDGLNASLDSGGRIILQAEDLNSTITPADVTGTPFFGGNSFNFPAGPYTADSAFASGGGPFTDVYTRQNDFPALANTTNPNTQGWWELTVIHPDGSTISQGLLNFGGDGTLNALSDSDNNIDIELNNIDWGNGANLQSLEIDIERYSQFAGNYDVIFSDQNGAELGLRTGVEINRDGVVIARFSNGASAQLYKAPLITFANANGLTEVSGTAYSESEGSGEENLREAGTGGAGFVEPSTLESSNVDLADEFAKLIVSQRAFGAGTRVINTVDQMTEDLLRLR